MWTLNRFSEKVSTSMLLKEETGSKLQSSKDAVPLPPAFRFLPRSRGKPEEKENKNLNQTYLIFPNIPLPFETVSQVRFMFDKLTTNGPRRIRIHWLVVLS